jgi:hypothetical protein
MPQEGHGIGGRVLVLHRKKFLLFISAVVIAINFVRCPALLLYPRFFAEEGTTYFSCAFQKSFLANIFSAHYGYYTLYNQLATSLAKLAPLEHAPLVTTIMSLLVQVGISLYVLWGDLLLLDTLWRRTVLALAIPLISWPGHWLTIIGTQCWLGAGTFLLLLSSDRSKQLSFYAAKAGYLVLAGLTGVVSCFMLPAYLLRAVREKSREFCGYTAILFLCLLVHVGVLLEALRSRSPELSTRFVFNSLETVLGKTVVYQFAVPFTGRGFYEQQLSVDIGVEIKRNVENFFGIRLFIHDQFIIPVIIGLAVIMLTAVIIWLNRSRLEVQVITVALISVDILSNFCSVNSAGGPRYYFIPSLILLTLFMCINDMKSHKPVIAVTALLVVTTLLGNGYEYRSIMYRQAYSTEYPDWRAELELWRMTPSYQINIWPKSWKMNLDKRAVNSET